MAPSNHPIEKRVAQEDEIDLKRLAIGIWNSRFFVIRVVTICFFLGLAVAFILNVEYQASSKLMPESLEGSSTNFGGLEGLAGLAGIDLGLESSESIAPELYSQIVKSLPFQIDLMSQPLYFTTLDSVLSAYHYFKEVERNSWKRKLVRYTIGLPSALKQLVSSGQESPVYPISPEILLISKEEKEILFDFSQRISIGVDKSNGVVSIGAEMPDPVAAAQLTYLVVGRLTDELVDYRIEKAKIKLVFIEERLREAKTSYNKKQTDLAKYVDRNKNLTSSLVQIERERLQNELDIAFEVYKGLASQLEQAKIKVKEETPVFKILEPVSVPVEKSRPRRMILILIASFIGFFGSIAYLYVRRDATAE